jgi:hypothetical protein
MKRNHVIAVLIVGFSLAFVLFIAPRGQAEKTKHGADSLASVLHSSAVPGAVHLNREDHDNPCAEKQERRNGDDEGEESDPRIRRGFEIAPVHLNVEDKNCALVGLGSYLVNLGGCNDCHDTGPAAQFVRGENPFFGQPKKVNPATYLGGGRVFPPISGPPSPAIISRNLTPSTKTGLPEGDHTFPEFLEILRTGKDFDHLHPNCRADVTTNCFPPIPPFDGDLLQVMPWPNLQGLTDHDIRAIYEYLKAIPCIRGNYPGPTAPGNIPPEPADRCQ